MQHKPKHYRVWTDVWFRGMAIGKWHTMPDGRCFYRRNTQLQKEIAQELVFLQEFPRTRERLILTDRELGI
jgi:hypothetical protein